MVTPERYFGAVVRYARHSIIDSGGGIFEMFCPKNKANWISFYDKLTTKIISHQKRKNMTWWDTKNTNKCMQNNFKLEQLFSESVENSTCFVITMLKEIFLLPIHFCHFVMTMSKHCLAFAKLWVSKHVIKFYLIWPLEYPTFY